MTPNPNRQEKPSKTEFWPYVWEITKNVSVLLLIWVVAMIFWYAGAALSV